MSTRFVVFFAANITKTCFAQGARHMIASGAFCYRNFAIRTINYFYLPNTSIFLLFFFEYFLHLLTSRPFMWPWAPLYAKLLVASITDGMHN